MKTICIYHSVDLDGWMSAAIVMFRHKLYNKEYYIKPFESKVEVPEYADLLVMLGYNYGQSIPDLTEYDSVIMCDISFPKDEMLKLEQRLGSKFIWIDHHISAINEIHLSKEGFLADGIRDTRYAACELTWCYFFPNDMDNMPELVTLLGLYDSFRSKGTEEHQKVLEFQYGSRQVITNYHEAYSVIVMPKEHQETFVSTTLEKGKAIYQYLCTEAKQSYKNGFEIILIEQCGFRLEEQIHRKFICINKERFNSINFGIDYHKDGYDGAACFYYANGKWNFSLYNDNGKVDCSVIAKQFGGGGHKGAAGFVCDNETILKIINNK